MNDAMSLKILNLHKYLGELTDIVDQ